ncbi:MAG: ROK family protein [Defluviitaleaceae bacterium]|nr:ROK family protein [Defluviitaleaceae bacterium]
MNLLTFDFGGRSVKYSLWTENKLLDTHSFSTPETWAEMQEELLKIKACFEKDYTLDGAAFSTPGCVDQENDVIGGNSAISFLHELSMRKELSELLGLPVTLENDANCAALAEVWSGAATGAKNVLFVVVGTGVGGAIVSEGRINPGTHFYGGEFGSMFLNIDGLPRRQNLSGLGTAVCMAERYCDRLGVPHLTYTGLDVFEKAKQGDTIAQEEVETFHKYLSIGLFNLQVSFDPEMIIIGGGISANQEIISTLESRVNDLLAQSGLNDFKAKILPCQYKNDANLLGAVKNFYDKVKS